MGISLNFKKFEERTLKSIEVINGTIDALIANENYSLAWQNVVMLRDWEKFYISNGLKYKNFDYLKDYLNNYLGVDTGKDIDEFKDYYGERK